LAKHERGFLVVDLSLLIMAEAGGLDSTYVGVGVALVVVALGALVYFTGVGKKADSTKPR